MVIAASPPVKVPPACEKLLESVRVFPAPWVTVPLKSAVIDRLPIETAPSMVTLSVVVLKTTASPATGHPVSQLVQSLQVVPSPPPVQVTVAALDMWNMTINKNRLRHKNNSPMSAERVKVRGSHVWRRNIGLVYWR